MLPLVRPGANKVVRASPGDVVRQYATEATLHGVRYLASSGVSAPGKVCWLAAIVTCGVFAGLFVHGAWLAYIDSPTRTSVESTHHPLHLVPFPAVTLCPATKVRRTVGMELLARHLNASAADAVTRQELWHVLAALSMNQFPFYFRMEDHLQGARRIIPLLGDLNITDFMLKVLPPCHEFFQECYWQGMQQSCCEVFKLQRYEAGFCYSFNSLAIDSNMQCSSLLDVQLGDYAEGAPGNHNCSLRRNGVSGTTTGLEVFLPHSKPEDSLGAGQRDINGARVFVHHPLQFPEAGKGLLMKEENDTVLTMRVSAAVTESSLAVRTLSLSERNCYFPDEWQLQVSRSYSQKNCLLECRLGYFIHKCQCVPYFFNLVFEHPVCNLSRLDCVASIDRDMRFLQLQATLTFGTREYINCSHCLPTCTDVSYVLSASTTRDFNRVVRGGYLDVYYADLSAIKYQRELTFNVMQLIVSFGGIAGLFLGVSLLSVVEMLYYAAVLVRAALGRWRPTPRLQQPPGGASGALRPSTNTGTKTTIYVIERHNKDKKKCWQQAEV